MFTNIQEKHYGVNYDHGKTTTSKKQNEVLDLASSQFPPNKHIAETKSTKSSNTSGDKKNEYEKSQAQKYINIDPDQLREISPSIQKDDESIKSSFNGIPSFISAHQKDEVERKSGQQLVAENVSSKEWVISRIMRKYVTFESHENTGKIAVYSFAQIVVWINLLVTKIFLLIIPVGSIIFASLGVIATPIVAVVVALVLALSLKKIIFAVRNLKDKFLHINKLQISADQKMVKYKSALRFATPFLLIHSLLFNVKSLRGQFISDKECPSDPHTFNTNGVVVVPDEIARKIVGEPKSDSSFSAKWSRHISSRLGIMRMFNFGMNILALTSLVCTTLSILSLPTIQALALPSVLQAIPFFGAFVTANPWAAVVVLIFIVICYAIGTYRTFIDNKLDRELYKLKLMTLKYDKGEENKEESIFLTQRWLKNASPAAKKEQIQLRVKILGIIYFELTKQKIPNDKLEKLTPKELAKMIRYEYIIKQAKLKEDRSNNWSLSKLRKEIISLRKKEIKKSIKSLEYYKLEDLAKLCHAEETIKANELINILEQHKHNEDAMSQALKQNIFDMVPNYLKDGKYSPEETFEIAKTVILNLASSETSNRVDHELRETMAEIKEQELIFDKLKKDKSLSKAKMKKAEEDFIKKVGKIENKCRKALIEKIKNENQEYRIDVFSEQIKDEDNKENLQKIYLKLATVHHDNEEDVIARLSLHRKTSPFLHRAGGWKEVKKFAYNHPENQQQREHNTMEKLLKNIVSECNQIDHGTLETTFEQKRTEEMEKLENLARAERLKKTGKSGTQKSNPQSRKFLTS